MSIKIACCIVIFHSRIHTWHQNNNELLFITLDNLGLTREPNKYKFCVSTLPLPGCTHTYIYIYMCVYIYIFGPRCNYTWTYNRSIHFTARYTFTHLIKIICMGWYTIWQCTSWYERKYNLHEKLRGNYPVGYFISRGLGVFPGPNSFILVVV